MRRGEKGLSVGYFVERCQRWQVAHCLYNLSVKKGAMAFEISSPAGNRSACQKVTPGEKFAYLLMREMRWPSSKKKKNPNGTSSVN